MFPETQDFNPGVVHHKAWRNYHKIGYGIPTFHKKRSSWSYQTNCQYIKQDEAYLDNGTVRFIDAKHVKLPKLGIVRIAGLRKLIKKRLLDRIPTRIGTASIKKTADDQFYRTNRMGKIMEQLLKIEHDVPVIDVHDAELEHFAFKAFVIIKKDKISTSFDWNNFSVSDSIAFSQCDLKSGAQKQYVIRRIFEVEELDDCYIIGLRNPFNASHEISVFEKLANNGDILLSTKTSLMYKYQNDHVNVKYLWA